MWFWKGNGGLMMSYFFIGAVCGRNFEGVGRVYENVSFRVGDVSRVTFWREKWCWNNTLSITFLCTGFNAKQRCQSNIYEGFMVEQFTAS